MPSGVYPEVTFPRVAVVARVPDWDVTQMEVKVTRPLEDAVSGVLGVARVRSRPSVAAASVGRYLRPEHARAETLTWNRIGANARERWSCRRTWS